MTYQEKLLYHQIHPFKLATDLACTAIALYFVWQHDWLKGILIAFVPSILVSMYVLKNIDLEPLKRSALGRYINGYMTKTMDMVRTGGLGVAAVGAWMHEPVLLILGLLIILYTWLAGLFVKKKTR